MTTINSKAARTQKTVWFITASVANLPGMYLSELPYEYGT